MPINDLSENVRIPRLGKFHLGFRDPAKNGAPTKTDYFVIEKDHPDKKRIEAIFGEKPKELRIQIPTENDEDWKPQYYKAYNMTYGLVCRGDGKDATRMVDIKTNELPNKETKTVNMVDMKCAGKECPVYKSKKCGEVMNLRFVLPEVPGLGVWQIDTGSINSILNINSCTKLIKVVFGRITNIPLKLTLEDIEVNNPETGKKQKVYVMNLRSDVTLAELADKARKQSQIFQIEAPDYAAAYDAQIEKNINELWGPENNNPKALEAKAKEVPPANRSAENEAKQQVSTDPQAQRQVQPKPPVAPEKPQDANPGGEKAEAKSNVDTMWLEETMKIVNWKDATIKSWIKANLKVEVSGTVLEMCNALPADKLEKVVKKLQEMRDASGK
jgi:hypothetical protein